MRDTRVLAVTAILILTFLGWSLSAREIVHIPLAGSINPVSRGYVQRAFSNASADDTELLLIELDTPGGLEGSMRDIVALELASEIPVVVYVSPSGARAASAGVFITLAADVAAMAPGTNIGAAHPVALLGGEEGADSSTSIDKAASDAAAFARSIAEQRGRNTGWAHDAVMKSSSLSATEALDQNVIDLVAEDLDALLARLDGYRLADGRILRTQDASLRTVRPTLRERLLGLLADPNLVYVLFILGLYGLIYEFFHPGIGFGLAVGGVCLLLALFGLQILPVSIAGIALVVLGVGLIVLDEFTPTNGILTAGGIVSLAFGSLTLFDIPDRHIGLSWASILTMLGLVVAVSVFILSKGLLVQRKRPSTGLESMVERQGVVRTKLDPEGSVFIHGEYWNATSVEGELAEGTEIVVDRVEAGRLYVRRVVECQQDAEHPVR